MVNDLSKDIEGKLAHAIATKKAELGVPRLSLPQLQVVIITLLSSEQRSDARRDARERGGKAYKAGEKGDPRKNRKGKKGEKEDTGPEWTVLKGKCKYCGKGAASGPDKGHWQRKCPLLIANGGSVDPETWVADKGSAKMGRAADKPCSSCDEDNEDDESGDESSGSGESDANPFGPGTGTTTVPLDSVATPRDLVAALTGGSASAAVKQESGHAKMAKPHKADKADGAAPVLVVVTPSACAGTPFKPGIHFAPLDALASALRLRHPDRLPAEEIVRVATLEDAVRVANALNTPTCFETALVAGPPLVRPATLFGRPYAPGASASFASGEDVTPPQFDGDSLDTSDDDSGDARRDAAGAVQRFVGGRRA